MIKPGYNIFKDEKHNVFQIRSKSEIILAEFHGDQEREIFEEIANFLEEGKNFESIAALEKHFENRYPKDKVLAVLSEMKMFDLLEEETIKETFTENLKTQLKFWDAGLQGNEYGSNSVTTQNKIRQCKLTIIGDSILSELMQRKAVESGFENTYKDKYIGQKNNIEIKELIDSSDFLIVDAENWNPSFLEDFNKIAYENNKPWILTRGMEGTKGSIGPLFTGKDSGCYQCLINRLKSNMEFFPYFEEYEKYLKKKKQTAISSGGPSAIYDVLASIALLESIKYITGWAIPVIYRAFIVIDIFAYDFKIHPFLKSPVCPVCFPKIDFKLAPWLEPLHIKK